jgi:hypothetical protein
VDSGIIRGRCLCKLIISIESLTLGSSNPLIRRRCEKVKKLILNGVASTLNAFGRAVVFSYDVCASGVGNVCDVAKKTPDAMGKVCDVARKTPDAMGKVCDVAKKTPDAMEKLCDVVKKAPDVTKKLFGLQQQGKPARGAPSQNSVKTKARETPQESAVKKEETIEEEEGDSPRLNTKLISDEKLKKMVKPQLISLCKNLNIECDYTDTKDQIIAKILERK